MARFCTQCGRRLEDGEVCNCTSQGVDGGAQAAGQENFQNQGEEVQNYQQSSGQMNQGQENQGAYDGQTEYGRQGQDPYSQQGQYYQQGQDPYGQQGQGQYYQQGQDPYGQQGQGQYYQQGQDPYGQQGQGQYYQQGQNPYGQQNQGQYYNQNQYYNQQGYPGGQGRSREAEWLNEKKNAFVAVTKNMFSEILPILKRPVGRVREIADSNSPAVGLEFMVTKLVVTILVGLILILDFKSNLGQMAEYVDLPYFQLLMIALIFTMGMDLVTALLLKVFAGLFGGSTSVNAMITVVGARAMYDSVFILIFGILFLLSAPAGILVAAIAAVLTPYIEYGGYHACGRISEDRVAYAYFVTKICMSVITFVLAFLLAWGVIQSLLSYAGNLL